MSTTVGRTCRFGSVQPLFVVDAEFAAAVSAVRWSVTRYGYLESFVSGQRQWLHRYVWFLAHGSYPAILDHINQVKWDCRISNLRPATKSLNARNCNKPRRFNDLPRGVSLRCGKARTHPRKYVARIKIHRKCVTLGYFLTAEEASAVYEEARQEAINAESRVAYKEWKDA